MYEVLSTRHGPWRFSILYRGASCSIKSPRDPFLLDQGKTKLNKIVLYINGFVF